jgi:hypothetical protein
MTARKLFVFFVFAVSSLGLASAGFSEGMVEDIKGPVIKIDGGKVIFLDQH